MSGHLVKPGCLTGYAGWKSAINIAALVVSHFWSYNSHYFLKLQFTLFFVQVNSLGEFHKRQMSISETA